MGHVRLIIRRRGETPQSRYARKHAPKAVRGSLVYDFRHLPGVEKRVTIPQEAVDAGVAGATLSAYIGEAGWGPDRACCSKCGRTIMWREDRCECGGTKPWIYRDERGIDGVQKGEDFQQWQLRRERERRAEGW